MRVLNSGVVAAAAALLVLSACSAADTSVTTTTTISTATLPTPSPTPSSSTTTQVPAGPTQDDIALALYLAPLYEIDADLVEDLAGPILSDDMQYEIITLEDAAARIGELAPPPSAQQLHQASVDVLIRFADVFRSFAEIGATATEATVDELLGVVMDEVSAIANETLDVQAERNRLATTVLAPQADDPDVWFVIQMMTVQAEATPATENAVTLVAQMFTNPDIEIKDLAVAMANFAPIVDAWQDIETPPRFESLRRRSEEVLSTVLTLVAELFDIAQTGEGFTDEEAATVMAVELTTLSLKTQMLEAERARAVAAVLRELAE